MDYNLGRFTTIDPLWENYYAWSPYQYSMNNPVSMVDYDGNVVRALDEASKDHIRNSVEPKYRDLVAFKDDGTVYLTDDPMVAPPRRDGDDIYTSNIGALKYLIGIEDKITVEEIEYGDAVPAKDVNGLPTIIRTNLYNESPNGLVTYGEAAPDNPDHVQSLDEVSHVYIMSELNPKHNGFSGVATYGSTAAHELYGHMLRYYGGVLYGHKGAAAKKAIIRAENNAKGRPEDTVDD